jgi:hypothetical protein
VHTSKCVDSFGGASVLQADLATPRIYLDLR